MKKTILLRTLIVLLLIFLIFNSIAVVYGDFNIKSTFTGEIAKEAGDSAKSVQDVLIVVLTAVRIVGMAIAIIMLIVVGIKIMVASPSERANIKQYTTNYLIGAFILLAASGILEIVKNVALSAFQS